MKKNKIIIFGTGGHAKTILAEIIRLKKYKVIGYIDEFKPIGTIIDEQYNLINLGRIKDLNSIADKNTFGVIGVFANYIRKRISNQVYKVSKKFKWEKIVSADAVIQRKVEIGEGTVIIVGSIIKTGTNIGKHCVINTNSSIGHDCNFSNFSSCGPKVAVGGNVFVGNSAFLGIHSTINHNIKIHMQFIIEFLGQNLLISATTLYLSN